MNEGQSHFVKALYTAFMLAMTIQAALALYDRFNRDKTNDHVSNK